MKSLLLAGLTALAALTAAPPADAQNVERVKIARNYISASGCHDNSQTFTASIPNSDKLDRSYQGVLAGIEVVEWTGVNGHAFRNFTFINNGTAISFELYAKGRGNWIASPFGGGVCAGAGGGSEGIEVYAHILK